MKVIINSDRAASCRLAADEICQLYHAKPDAVLGLATGSSPLGIYDELSRRIDEHTLSLSHATAFLLDEYVGLPADHPETYRNVISRDFTTKVDIDPRHVHGLDSAADDLNAACTNYERRIAEAGGIDLQILGIGTDGHIAFNEPGSSLASRTRPKTLTRQTRQDNARFFANNPHAVPRHCLTQGIGTILDASWIVLLAHGEPKAEAVHQLVEGAVSALWPATALQFHPNVTVFIDDAAASRLQLAPHFREVADH